MRTFWSGAIIFLIGFGAVCAGAATAAPLSADAQADPELQGLPQEGWRCPGALNPGNGKNIVQVQSAAGAKALGGATAEGGAGATIDLVYAMPELKPTKKKQLLPAGDGQAEFELTGLDLGNAPAVGDPGKPVLPVVPCYVVLPAGQICGDVKVTTGSNVKIPGTHTVRHGQKAIPLVPGAEAEYVPPDPEVYGSDDPWPRERFKVIGVQKKRGVSILIVNLNPVVYRPKSGSVSYFTSLRLKVQTKPEEAAPDSATAVTYRPDPARPLSNQVDNPLVLRTYGAAQ